jgi:hypothetical protein
VKLDQGTNYIDPAYPDLGFDLDAVVALNALHLSSDADGDGVPDAADLCPGTSTDASWSGGWGTNRWQVMSTSGLGWYQNKPKGVSGKIYDMGYTYGCNGHQILTMLKDKLGAVMNGHWKFGLSSSVLEEFHTNFADGNISGRYFIETVTVPANKETDSNSVYPLVSAINYVLKSRGTACAEMNTPGVCTISFDADYSNTPALDGSNWVDGVTNYSPANDLLDLKVNGNFVNWGTYSSSHEYTYPIVGGGNNATFRIYDVYYPNNTGNLYVDIYAQL